jgi:XTP/dITP diphosphohydrolase
MPGKRLLIATTNQGKIAEFISLFSHLPLRISTLEDVGLAGMDVEETGSTFSENSELKARAYAQASGIPTVADDSGLEVKALDGKPGVYSSRWHEGSPSEKNQHLLEIMADKTDRSARFVAAISLAHPDNPEQVETFIGTVEGQIAQAETGSEGFGYDPIFIPEGYEQSFAELGTEVKNTLSHRYRALKQLEAYLTENINAL